MCIYVGVYLCGGVCMSVCVYVVCGMCCICCICGVCTLPPLFQLFCKSFALISVGLLIFCIHGSHNFIF